MVITFWRSMRVSRKTWNKYMNEEYNKIILMGLSLASLRVQNSNRFSSAWSVHGQRENVRRVRVMCVERSTHDSHTRGVHSLCPRCGNSNERPQHNPHTDIHTDRQRTTRSRWAVDIITWFLRAEKCDGRTIHTQTDTHTQRTSLF